MEPVVLAVACVVATPIAFVVFLMLYELLTFKAWKPAAKPSKSLGNVRFSQQKMPAEVDTIVIGSGSGGLCCAATLSQFGERVVVLEQHEVTGGGAHTFAVDGKKKWMFDAGLHITIPMQEQVLQLACGAGEPPVAFERLRDASGSSDNVVLGGAPADEKPLQISTADALEDELCQRFPVHAEAIHQYMLLADQIQMRFGVLTACHLLPIWLRRRLLHSPFMGPWRSWAQKTSEEALRELFPGDDVETCKLRSYLVGLWLDTGAPPSRCSFFMQTAVCGGWQKVGVAYPVGGPQRTALALVEAVEARGGAVFVRCPVAQILLDGAHAAVGVRLASGDELKAKRVVSAIGYRATEGLLPPEAPSAPKPLQTPQSEGFLMANIGLRGSAAELGLTKSSLWVQPASATNSYDALAGERSYHAAPLDVPTELVPVGITFPSVKGTLPPKNGHGGAHGGANGSTQNGHAAHADAEDEYHTCQILCAAEYDWFKAHQPLTPPVAARHAPPHLSRTEQPTYDELKTRWAERLTAILQKWYPRIAGHVEFVDISTPLTIEHYLKARRGGAVGLDVTPARFVNAEEMAEVDMQHPRIRGLWRAGQDHLMCGQVIAAASGVLCALRMCGTLAKLRFIARAFILLLRSTSRAAPINGHLIDQFNPKKDDPSSPRRSTPPGTPKLAATNGIRAKVE